MMKILSGSCAKFLEDKAKHISKEYLEMYEDIRDNGATYRVE